MSPQISSFSVSPNYEIVFFSSEIYEVISILNFLNRGVALKDITSEIEKFVVGGELHRSKILLEILRCFNTHILMHVLLHVHVCFDSKTNKVEQI